MARRGSIKDFMIANRLERIVKEYRFELFSCVCGEVYDIEDFLLMAAKALKEGKADRRVK